MSTRCVHWFVQQTQVLSLALITLASLITPTLAIDLAQWTKRPTDWTGAVSDKEGATLTALNWSYLVAPQEMTDFDLSANITITEPAKSARFFGESWSVWPDHTYGDGGFEAGVLVRGGQREGYPKDFGYRVQLSQKYQQIALVKFPDGGYLRSVPCEVPLGKPLSLQVSVQGNRIVVSVNGAKKIDCTDSLAPLMKGQVAIGSASNSKVRFDNVVLTERAATNPNLSRPAHQPNFAVRTWIGGRQWVFDGDEPILLLPAPESISINNVKLRPGYKPQLSWNSHWDTQNQGAFKEAENTTVDVQTSGGGASLVATWRGKHTGNRFETRSKLTVGYDAPRDTYFYDVESNLEVFAGQPFHFRYGYDFEHHTPLDPFNWQYLVARKRGGELYHRPVYPIDPGPQNDLETYHGLRVWYGRHNEPLQIAPAVEYHIDPGWNPIVLNDGKKSTRPLNTAVCAAFYDTGVSFSSETAAPGTNVRVKYRYTGYPAAEAKTLFDQSKIYESHTLDPSHYYIFADEWPKLTFSKFEPLSKTWIYGRTPFMTAHNTRPTYELERHCGAGSGNAMKLGPASFAKANWPLPSALSKGRYALTALVKSVNAHGPGGRFELEATQAKTAKVLTSSKHFVGNGSFEWKPTGFVFELLEDAAAVSLAFGNSGTGEMLVTDVELKPLSAESPLPAGVVSKPNDQPPAFATAPAGAIADYRMQEGRGHFVFNHAPSHLGHLDLANIDWVTDEGRPAIRFAENTTNRKDYRRDSGLGRIYLGHPAYAGKDTLPLALTGHHGGGDKMQGLTMTAWIKPAVEMGKSAHGGKGDVIGFGARRFILSLHGQTAPYQLAARINVNDVITSETKLAADKWYHLAMTAEPKDGQWQVRLYLDGKQVGEGQTKKFPSDSVIVPSLILGAEIFYMHDAYYRGLIGRTQVFDRVVPVSELGVRTQ